QGVLLKPLPYPQPDRLISLDHSAPGVDLPHAGMAPFLYFTYRENSKTFDTGIWQGDSTSVTGIAEPEQVPGVDVTVSILPMLGAQPVAGRLFTEADDAPGTTETVILSHSYWQRRFSGDASAIGRSLVLDGRPTQIVGVLSPKFRFLDRDAD